ncbi:uncharacterized protein LOC111911023 [Lactuca sativa]|uniref:uncharacterized protein LOC111911023 n=1 Tax=Lactuca sativa TaxID=4236 RepID=UPI0022B014CD|nr:uncharacterized protein LOC111911023 [Lactuca sativa]
MAEKRSRASWSSDFVNKTFLDACIQELTSNGREGSGLKGTSWNTIAKKLKKEHDFVVDKKQMKYRYDYLKSKYAVWLKLKNKTGNLYNPITNTFQMTDEEWKAEAKLNKMVEKLRNAPLLYPELCTQLFDGATSTGAASWGPSSTLPHPAEAFTTQDYDDIEMVDTAPQMDIPASTSTVPPPTSASHASVDSSVRSKNKRGKRNASTDTLDDDIREVGKEIMKAAQAFAQTHNLDKEMDECIEKLKVLEWGSSDPKYITVLMLFAENAGNRKIWLRLESSTCELWVKSAGKNFGLLG